jgi:excisionase family DNA binding protein
MTATAETSAPRVQVTVAEAARMLAIHPVSVRRKVQQGQLTATGHGRGYRVVVESIHAYLEQQKR